MGLLKKAAILVATAAAKGAVRAAGAVWDNREELKKAAAGTAKTASDAGRMIVSGAASAAGYVSDHRKEISGGACAVGSSAVAAGKGALQLACDAGGMAVYSNKRIVELREVLQLQGLLYKEVQKRTINSPLMESIAVGGSLLSDIISQHETPADIQRAYELAYPHEAAAMSFDEKAALLHDKELMGLVNGVKGKLFEMKYTDYLNSGELPDGYTAHLAASSTQPGWDIAVSGPDGHLAEVLQMKAADSVSYVNHALERYPDIHVVTTDEVYDKLVLHGAAEGVSSSGMSDSGLEDYIGKAVEDVQPIEMHWTPPLIAFALHAFTAYRLDGSLEDKARHFGDRAGKSWLCYLLGGAVAATTQVGWIGMVTGITTRYLAAKGRGRRELCQEMERQVARNRILLKEITAD